MHRGLVAPSARKILDAEACVLNAPDHSMPAMSSRILRLAMILSCFAISIADAKPTLQVDGTWLLVDMTKQEALARREASQCRSELESLALNAAAPLIGINWLHRDRCIRDWLPTAAWPLRPSLAFATRLKQAGFAELRSDSKGSPQSEANGDLSLTLGKNTKSASSTVWIYCSASTCRIYASEIRRTFLANPPSGS